VPCGRTNTDLSTACFYRAMLCIRRTAITSCPYVRPRLSVCLSVTCRYCVKMAKHRRAYIIKLFHRRIATPFEFFEFFHTKRYDIIIQTETPLTRASNARGMEKIAIISEMTQDRTMIQCSYMADQQ